MSDGEEGEKKGSLTDLFRKILEGLRAPVRQETVGWVGLASCPKGPLRPGPAWADTFHGSPFAPSEHQPNQLSARVLPSSVQKVSCSLKPHSL